MTKSITIKLVADTALPALVLAAKKAGTKYVEAVQAALMQSIGHALKTGDTVFVNRLLETFTDGTVGKATFVRYVELHACMMLKKKVFVWNNDTKHEIAFKGTEEEIEAYLNLINEQLWTMAKPEKVVSIYDVEEIVANAIKKAMAKSKEGEGKVANVGLLKHLTAAMAQYHSEKLGVVAEQEAAIEASVEAPADLTSAELPASALTGE